MKRNSYLLLVLFFACTTIFSSCKKDEEKPTKSRTELLSGTTSKTWKQTDEQMSYGGSSTSIFKMFRSECSQDDITIFFIDKKYEEREGVKKCDSDDLLETAKWSLSTDEKNLTVDYGTYKDVWTIKELNDKVLKLEIADPDMAGASIINTYTAQ